MLKINPHYKIYEIGFDETIKSLLAEGFIDECNIEELTIVNDIKFGLRKGDGLYPDGDPYYEVVDENGVHKIPFCMIYYAMLRKIDQFVITVCKEEDGVLIPEGFVCY